MNSPQIIGHNQNGAGLHPRPSSLSSNYYFITLLAVGLILTSACGTLALSQLIDHTFTPLSISLAGASILGLFLTLIASIKLWKLRNENREIRTTPSPQTPPSPPIPPLPLVNPSTTAPIPSGTVLSSTAPLPLLSAISQPHEANLTSTTSLLSSAPLSSTLIRPSSTISNSHETHQTEVAHPSSALTLPAPLSSALIQPSSTISNSHEPHQPEVAHPSSAPTSSAPLLPPQSLLPSASSSIAQVLPSEAAAIPSVDPSSKDNEGLTPLHHAVTERDQTKIRQLLALGTRYDVPDNEGQTPLYLAVKNRDPVSVALLIRQGRGNIDFANENGWTALHRAVVNEDIEIVRLLVEGGAHSDLLAGGWTQLSWAVRLHNKNIVEMLSARGRGDIDKQNSDGNRALTLAFLYATHCHISLAPHFHEITKILITAGARLDLTNKEGQPMLHLAVLTKNKETVEFLLDHGRGYDMNAVNGNNQTALHLAIAPARNKDIVELLIHRHARIDICDDTDKTPLLLSLRDLTYFPFNDDGKRVLQYLVSQGVDKQDSLYLDLSAAAIWGIERNIEYHHRRIEVGRVEMAHSFFLLSQALEQFFTEHPNALSNEIKTELLEMFKKPIIGVSSFPQSEIEQILGKIAHHQLVAVAGGFAAHCLGILLYDGGFAIANRGIGMNGDQGITFYRSNERISKETIEALSKTHPNAESFNRLVASLGREERGLRQKPQKVGNCVLANLKALVYAFVYKRLGAEKANEAKNFYKIFSAYLRLSHLNAPSLQQEIRRKVTKKLNPYFSSRPVYSSFQGFSEYLERTSPTFLSAQ